MAKPARKIVSLFDRDYHAWMAEQLDHLRHGRWRELDVENLAEELESLVRSDRREIVSRLEVLLTHLLKWRFQQSKQSQSWIATIDEQRRQIEHVYDDSPSLSGYPATVLSAAYAGARRAASKETGLPISTFPELCPFTIEQVLAEDWLP